MIDSRVQRMARVLVQYSLGIKPGERLGIKAGPPAIPLVREVAREALASGAFPEIFLDLPGWKEMLLREGSDAQLASISDAARLMAEEYEAALEISSLENTQELNTLDPERIARHNQAQARVFQAIRSRSQDGSLHRSITLYPTNAYAQDAGMSFHEFEDFFYHACFLDDEDPIARWQALSRQQKRLVEWLAGKHTVHILGPETDLRLSIDGRVFLSDDGRYNFPGGEFFTGPVEESAQGHIRFSFPSSYGGRSVDNVRLRFEEGTVVEAQAEQGQAYLEHMLGLDEGARRLGEFAFGNNAHITRCIKNTLFDEKMSGTVHLALGASFSATGGRNQSLLHWDMVYDLRQGSEVWIDDELFNRDGHFLPDNQA